MQLLLFMAITTFYLIVVSQLSFVHSTNLINHLSHLIHLLPYLRNLFFTIATSQDLGSATLRSAKDGHKALL
ncbi:hypothetical protein V2G26_017320 [Clonostachys chloroleuca]